MTTPRWVDPEKIIGWIIPGIVYLVTIVYSYAAQTAATQLLEQRVVQIEKAVTAAQIDHDLLIKISVSLEDIKSKLYDHNERGGSASR